MVLQKSFSFFYPLFKPLQISFKFTFTPRLKVLWNQKGTCKMHERTHKKQCEYYDKRFISSLKCKRHERTHTAEKRYKRKYCDKCFSEGSYCEGHERVHTREKRYQCKHCGEWFTRLRSLNQHKKNTLRKYFFDIRGRSCGSIKRD